MENNIMGLVGAFIGIAIMLGIGVQILGNSVQDCTNLPDWNATAPLGNASAPASSYDPSVVEQTGWSLQCQSNNAQSQNAYTLLVIILIVVAAVAILSVVRML